MSLVEVQGGGGVVWDRGGVVRVQGGWYRLFLTVMSVIRIYVVFIIEFAKIFSTLA